MANTYTFTITNPGAETGDMTGWSNSGMIANTGANIGGQSRPANTGTYFFKGTYNTAAANAYQEFVITSTTANTDIDANLCVAFLSWSQNSYSTGNDNGRVEIEFLTAANVTLNVTRSSNSSYSSWTRRNLDDTRVPYSTRRLRVRMVSIRASGTDNDGYFDDFSNLVIVAGGANGDNNVATVYTEAVTPVADILYSNVTTLYTEAVTSLAESSNINIFRAFSEAVTLVPNSPLINVTRTFAEVVTLVPNSPLINVTRTFAEVVTPIPEGRANVVQMYVEVVSDINAASLPPKWKNKTIATTLIQ